ncbi:hypothetical protein D3C81_1364550 [compost metagenome]
MQDRAPRGQRVGGGPGRGRHDQAVRTLVVHKVAIHGHRQLDHAGNARAVHHHVVQRQRRKNDAVVAYHAGLEQQPVLGLVAAVEHVRQHRVRVFQRDVGHEAEPPVVNPDQRHVVAGQLAGDAQQRAVAAQHHRHVRVLADFLGRQGRVGSQPGGQRGLALEHHILAVAQDIRGDLLQRAFDAGSRVAAHQGDGVERSAQGAGSRGGGHAGIRPYRRCPCQQAPAPQPRRGARRSKTCVKSGHHG